MRTRKRIAGLFSIGAAACLLTVGLAAPASASPPVVGDRIVNSNSGKCAADPSGSTTPGIPAIQFNCNPEGPSKRWAVTVYPKDFGGRVVYSFRSISANQLCLTATGGNGGAVVLDTCVSGALNQRWAYDSLNRLISVSSGYLNCLAVPGGQTSDAVQLIQFKCGTGFEQKWTAFT